MQEHFKAVFPPLNLTLKMYLGEEWLERLSFIYLVLLTYLLKYFSS